MLPLHWAACNQPPLDVIEALLRAYPDAASAPDGSGRLALHWAAHFGASLEVIMALLEAHPAAASSTASTYDGHLPLHDATMSSTPASVGVVAALLAAFPEGAAVRSNANDGSRLPNLSRYPQPAILAALKAAAVGRRWRAPIAWHMWHRM